MVAQPGYLESDLDGEEPGGFVVVNVDAVSSPPYQLLEAAGEGYFPTLSEARQACERFREEGDNLEIYVYALVGVREAIGLRPDVFPLAG